MNVTKADRTVGLDRFGPGCESAPTTEESRAWCLRLTRTHGENFHVLSRFVPADRVGDFAAVYAFCRCADDLGDEAGSTERATELLAWWRRELHRCFEGDASHPVFVALRETIQRRSLVQAPFDDLISAFEMDQRKGRYDTFDDVLGYCALSANPVGRLVLALLGEPLDDESCVASDAICTALQLTNHWQDARRDLLERDRIYIPRDAWATADFEQRFLATVRQGYAPDREFLGQWREMTRTVVERTWPLFVRGHVLLDRVAPQHRPLLWLFVEGGTRTLREIERWNYETCLSRPKLSVVAKALLLLRARWASVPMSRAAL